ncbi:hypothetical protein MEA186_28637 [Mesorhizobium amorphae CCNWGS0123]|uniref:Uncharacterized protein n=1 Tax=Mesorhizobium amorphae CCNWGS0123 TaxID=1082933 RepID=G6YIA7_9HYPH|nr:hypothetical protein MEA186_28637 [Mesorhizobium amorphae CCNWGS0123]
MQDFVDVHLCDIIDRPAKLASLHQRVGAMLVRAGYMIGHMADHALVTHENVGKKVHAANMAKM